MLRHLTVCECGRSSPHSTPTQKSPARVTARPLASEQEKQKNSGPPQAWSQPAARQHRGHVARLVLPRQLGSSADLASDKQSRNKGVIKRPRAGHSGFSGRTKAVRRQACTLCAAAARGQFKGAFVPTPRRTPARDRERQPTPRHLATGRPETPLAHVTRRC